MRDEHLPELVLVEDSLSDELMSLRGISKSGIPCNVTVRRDGEEALELLLFKATAPTLIVLDYCLPKLNGLEILKRLKANERTQLIPIVMVSDSNSGSTMAECYRVGANSCVTKPGDPIEYVERLASVTRYWLTINEMQGRHAS